MSDGNILEGPWPKPAAPPRRPLAELVHLAGGLQKAVSVAMDKPAHVHDDLLRSFAAKLECFAGLARSLSDQAKSVHKFHDAAALNIMADDAESRAANIELELEIY